MQFSPQMMQQASQMFANMNDDQIRQYCQMAGMGQVDPSFIRNQAKNMGNYNQAQQPQQPQQPQQQKPVAQTKTEPHPEIAKLKDAGNKAFEQGKYDEAASKYLEAIIDIEELKQRNKFLEKDPEFKDLEIKCRLNYCSAKAKQQEFDNVLEQSQIILKIDQNNARAIFRKGQALFEKQNYEEAYPTLQLAQKQLPNDPVVKEYIIKLDKIIEQKQQKNVKTEQEIKQQAEQLKEPVKQESQKQESQKQDTQKQDTQKPKKNLSSVDVNSEEFQAAKKQRKQSDDDVEIIEEKPKPQETKQQPPQQQFQNPPLQFANPPQQFANPPNDEVLQKQFEQMKNMSPEQMQQMTNMLKSMDKGVLKQMMKAQGGMDLDDKQIEMMQNMMTPEMLESVKKMDPNQLRRTQSQPQAYRENQFVQQPQAQQTQQTQQTQQQPQANTGQVPTMDGLLQNPEMINMMIEQIKSNPQLLKSMAPMFGDNAMGKYITNSSDEQLKSMVSKLAIFLKFVLISYRAYVQVKNQWKFILGFLVAYILLKLF
ncbi:hypothetical protein pb186bvf_008886 [Paramecium bursaria]